MKKKSTAPQKKYKRRYDLPLHRSVGSHFMVWMVSFMIFLATLSLWADFAVSEITERWTTGLTGKITVEIRPPGGKAGSVALDVQATEAVEILNGTPGIRAARLLDTEEVAALVQPWLGEDISADILPLPALIDVDVEDPAQVDIRALEKRLQSHIPNAAVDDHGAWLQDLLNLAGTIKLCALLLTIVVSLTTIVAVAGAARTRLALHHDEVELLHLMGASNGYIAGQFQRHAFISTLKGATIGLALALLALLVLSGLRSDIQSALLPDISLSIPQWLILAALPVLGSLIATLTARLTVQNTLSRMP